MVNLGLILLVLLGLPGIVVAAEEEKKVRFDEIASPCGIQLSISPTAFGGNALVPQQAQAGGYGSISLSIEYQPPFLQNFGVLSFGPILAAYPALSSGLTSSFVSLSSIGIQTRYQLRYLKGQYLVPVVGYSLQYFKYQFMDGTAGAIPSVQNAMLGLWIYLNSLEPAAAANLYIDSAIRRTYLVIEAQNMTGKDDVVFLRGVSIFFGLRFEF